MQTRRQRKSWIGYSVVLGGLGASFGFVTTACTEVHEDTTIHEYHFGGDPGEGGAPASGGSTTGGSSSGGSATGGSATGGEGGDGDDGYTSHLPACEELVPLDELDVDLFGKDGNTFYFEVTPEAREDGDERACSVDGGSGEDGVYDWDDEPTCPLPAFNVRVVPRDSDTCSDTGEVELKLVGQSSFKPWIQIPNFNLDVGEFQDLEFGSGDKHLRFNNGQADSTIVREPVALRIWRALDYPAPPTSFARTRSNVWDTEVRVGAFAAHVLVQSYKKRFFKNEMDSAVHVWEGSGDPFGESGWYDVECQWTDEDECDDDALDAIVDVVRSAPVGSGFRAATESVVDWPAVFANQCLAALTGTGDDWLHNNNNVVLVLREDGKVQYLPYSTDISGGHPWYEDTPWEGTTAYLAQGCQADEECLNASLDACDAMVDQFEALDVVTNIVEERCEALEAAGLQRQPDEAVCESLAEFYEERPAALRAELQEIRDNGPGGQGGAGPVDGGMDGGPADGGWLPD